MAQAQKERLRKSSSDRVMFGVAGGLAEHLDVDSTLVRVAFVVLGFASGIGLIAYIVLALVMPEAVEGAAQSEDSTEGAALAEESTPATEADARTKRNRNFIGGLLVIVGILFLLLQVEFFSWLRWGLIWPLVIIAAGVALIWDRSKKLAHGR